MANLKIRRIDLTASDAKRQIARLREQFHNDNEIVSTQAKKITQAVFGKRLLPVDVVEKICTDVRNKRLSPVQHYTELLDKVKLKPDGLRVKESDLVAAHAAADPSFLDVIRR